MSDLKNKLVIVESPFAPSGRYDIHGEVSVMREIEAHENVRYVRACMHDVLRRGGAPFASHALYTLPGVLDDTIPEERTMGMEAGFLWGRRADVCAIYCDLGTSDGMGKGIARHVRNSIPLFEFTLSFPWGHFEAAREAWAKKS